MIVKIQRVALILCLFISCSLSACTAQPTALPPAAPPPSLPPATLAPARPTDAPPPTMAQAAAATALSPTTDPSQAARALLEAESLQVSGAAPTVIHIVLHDVQNLYGAEVHLTYDPAILQIEDGDDSLPGVQCAAGPDFTSSNSFVALNRVNQQKGAIDFAVTLLNPAAPLQGKVVLASFTVRAKQAGSTQISFSQTLLADRNGQPLPLASQGGVKLDAQP